MIIIILFIVLILFIASITVLLYTRPSYRHIAIPVDDIESLLDDKRDD